MRTTLQGLSSVIFDPAVTVICFIGIAYSKSNYTLDCLKHILPLYNYNYDYNTWHYYADLGSLGRNFSVFPYMILTSKYVCMLSDDLQDGYLSNDLELIKMMKERFEKYGE